ncbi:MAG: UDP-2,3-diacylglucosamine diphosphatase [Gammaproteobacteria bacterium]|nr:UDP-2,3-diacylglucosamine diphosphatase [Gammaproteobacteria bacterium]NBT45259.1 UDP-2,3-diacylglucosamine diphosphatase [Gammaproteobacteria bacterium]NDE33679.1 UDP-2,3-diacylglucosamine diphosphatase [Gammaproteobacteria bacterium]NDE55668.1 UDP-2,3-diacylglucosamine diphosphatase [Gammaproteobacteria bacterium]NDG86835.1 UDP-2,3-diacylglucosamine diphosphatase [Gammaproteobacteria bacterium]
MITRRYKTIFISDLHIGSTQCQADTLLDFLKHNESETLYLVGDIIDFWALSKRVYWPRDHNTIIQKILRKARHDTKVIYVPGNHDENVREYDEHVFGDIEVRNSIVHTTVDGKRFLVVHGDEYDTIAKYHQWIAKLGSKGYDFLLEVNRAVRAVRRVMGIQSHFSLAAYIKFKVKNAVQFISDYEQSIVMTLKDEGLDGVICGHIHHAEIKEMDGFLYVNTGDFVESCTAIVEHDCGRLELIRWDPSLMSKVENLVEDMTGERDLPPEMTDAGAAV